MCRRDAAHPNCYQMNIETVDIKSYYTHMTSDEEKITLNDEYVNKSFILFYQYLIACNKGTCGYKK